MVSKKSHTVFISALEVSAENLAIDLINSNSSETVEFSLAAIGSKRLEQQGAKLIADNTSMNIMGLTQLIPSAKKIISTLRLAARYFKTQKPDLVILIDSSGFNLKLAKIAKQNGCKVLYYVSPQIWASRFKRIKKIQRYVDHMAVLYPFEQAIYQQNNVSASYVGHPVALKIDQLLRQMTREDKEEKENSKLIALLPGSRTQEIKKLLPVMVKTITILKKKYPNSRFILPVAHANCKALITKTITSDIELIESDTLKALARADCAICTSGTATLELALLGVPHVVVYKTSSLNYAIAKKILTTDYISLPNILSGQKIIPELLQSDVTPERVFKNLQPMINNPRYSGLIKKSFDQLRHEMTDVSNITSLTRIIDTLLAENETSSEQKLSNSELETT